MLIDDDPLDLLDVRLISCPVQDDNEASGECNQTRWARDETRKQD